MFLDEQVGVIENRIGNLLLEEKCGPVLFEDACGLFGIFGFNFVAAELGSDC